MRKLIYGVLLAAVGFGAVSAKIHTNKTFLMPRSHNENMAMEYTTWHKTVRAIDESGDKFGASFQAVPFYQQSTNDTNLGKYFGMYNNATGITPNVNKTIWNPYSGNVQDFIWVAQRDVTSDGNLNIHYQSLLLDTRFIFHGATHPYINVQGLLRPDSESYGVRLDYHQNLDKITKGLYLKVTAPILEVKNRMGISYTSTTNQTIQAVNGASGNHTLDDYLSGRYENTSVLNKQAKLTHAKVGSDSTSGVADVDVTLGYNFLYREDKHCGVNVCMTIPTGGSPNGDMLFEAVVGNGGHFALGIGVDSAFELWKSKSRTLEMLLAANYKYLFDSTEVRTLNIKYRTISTDTYLVSNKVIGHGFYLLGGKNAVKGVFPLANVLTREVGVHPSSMFEGLASFCMNWGKFSWDLGYNLFAKGCESVTMVKNWPENTYAVADPSYTGGYSFGGVGNTGIWQGSRANPGEYIRLQDLDLVADQTPVYVTHKIFTGVGVTFDWRFPLLFGLGGSWEWAQGSNSALDGWALWGKLGVCF